MIYLLVLTIFKLILFISIFVKFFSGITLYPLSVLDFSNVIWRMLTWLQSGDQRCRYEVSLLIILCLEPFYFLTMNLEDILKSILLMWNLFVFYVFVLLSFASCFFPLYNSFIDNCISCSVFFFRSSLTFISDNIKQKTGSRKTGIRSKKTRCKKITKSKKQETKNTL